MTAGDFEAIEDPLRGDAARHDVHETPVIRAHGYASRRREMSGHGIVRSIWGNVLAPGAGMGAAFRAMTRSPISSTRRGYG